VRYAAQHVFPGSLSREGTPSSLDGMPLTPYAADEFATAERATAMQDAGWRLNRAFLRMVGKPTTKIDFKLLIDFAELMRKNPKRSLKLAYVDVNPWKRIHVTAGLFKRTFSLLELLPIAQFELADVGPTDNFLKNLGYAGRDVGAMLQVKPLHKKKALVVSLGAFGGDVDRDQSFDSNPGKLITARVESEPSKAWRLGADVAWRPWDNDQLYDKGLVEGPPRAVLGAGWATSADVTLRLGGFEARSEAILGTRSDVDDPYYPNQVRRGDARQFQAAWLLAAYHFRAGDYGVMPAARVEWLDGDRKRTNGGLVYVSGGVNVDPTRNVRLLMDVSYQNAQPRSRGYDDAPFLSNKYTFYPYLVDFVVLTVQMQLLL